MKISVIPSVILPLKCDFWPNHIDYQKWKSLVQKEIKKNQLTVRLRSNEKRDALEPLDVGRRHMARALVVPLPVRIQRVELHAPTGVRHPELTPASPRSGGSLEGVKFQLGRRGRIEGDAARRRTHQTSPPARGRSPPPPRSTPLQARSLGRHRG